MMFRTVLTFLFLMALTPLCANAQGKEAYTVRDVKVDIVAESAVKARNQAFAAAQEKAFGILSERFLTPDQMAGFKPPSATAISGMVSDFEITSEQLSKRRYLGTYIFRFKENAVYRYFGHGPINGDIDADAASARLLLIPVFSQKGEASLWDTQKNPWLQAWQKNDNSESGFIVPEGNTSDKMDMREAEISRITQSSLKRMKSRYGVNDVAILSAVFDQKAKDKLKIDIYRTDRGRIELVQTLPVEIGKATKLGELLVSAVPDTETVLKGNWKGVQEAYQDPYQISANDPYAVTAPGTENSASQTVSQQPAMAGQIRALARFNSMGDWLNMRRSLNGIQSLRSIRILALTTNQARMELGYSDWMAFTSSLSARGLALQPIGPGDYSLIRNPTGY